MDLSTQLPEKTWNKVNAHVSKSKMLSKSAQTLDEPVQNMLIFFIVFGTISQLKYALQYIEIFMFDKRCLNLHIKRLFKSIS